MRPPCEKSIRSPTSSERLEGFDGDPGAGHLPRRPGQIDSLLAVDVLHESGTVEPGPGRRATVPIWRPEYCSPVDTTLRAAPLEEVVLTGQVVRVAGRERAWRPRRVVGRAPGVGSSPRVDRGRALPSLPPKWRPIPDAILEPSHELRVRTSRDAARRRDLTSPFTESILPEGELKSAAVTPGADGIGEGRRFRGALHADPGKCVGHEALAKPGVDRTEHQVCVGGPDESRRTGFRLGTLIEETPSPPLPRMPT